MLSSFTWVLFFFFLKPFKTISLDCTSVPWLARFCPGPHGSPRPTQADRLGAAHPRDVRTSLCHSLPQSRHQSACLRVWYGMAWPVPTPYPIALSAIGAHGGPARQSPAPRRTARPRRAADHRPAAAPTTFPPRSAPRTSTEAAMAPREETVGRGPARQRSAPARPGHKMAAVLSRSARRVARAAVRRSVVRLFALGCWGCASAGNVGGAVRRRSPGGGG